MRVAALFDIHANLPALEAVIARMRGVGINLIVVGGDVVPGPMVRETLALLRSAGAPCVFIHGNGETEILAARAGRELTRVPANFRDAIEWNAAGLSEAETSMVESWPLTARVEVPGLGTVLFCHATPRGDNELFTKLTPTERLLPIFSATGADVVVCGHTHMQFDRQVGSVRVVNAGSVGMPFGRTGADWLLIGPAIEFQHTDYDLADAAARIRATAYPQAEFAANAVLNPRSEEEMAALFERAALGGR